MTIVDQVFRETTLLIDGQRFVRCQFIDCQLVYEARDEVAFDDCTFRRCDWTFDGAAGRMIGFLSILHERTGPDGPELAEAIFQSIRSQKAASIRMSGQSNLNARGVVVKPVATT